MRRVSRIIDSFLSFFFYFHSYPTISIRKSVFSFKNHHRTYYRVHRRRLKIWHKNVYLEWNLIILMNEFVYPFCHLAFSTQFKNNSVEFQFQWNESKRFCTKLNWRKFIKKNSNTLNRMEKFFFMYTLNTLSLNFPFLVFEWLCCVCVMFTLKIEHFKYLIWLNGSISEHFK